MEKRISALFLIFALLITLFPFIWAFSTSLRSDIELLQAINLIPHQLTTENYSALFGTNFVQWLLNSFYLSISVSLLSTSLSIPISYIITHRSQHVQMYALLFFSSGFLLPSGILFLPLSKNLIITEMPNLLALGIIYLSFICPQAVWLLSSFSSRANRRLEKVCRIEGGSTYDYILKILVPQISKGVIFTLLYCFIISWGEYTYAFVLTSTSKSWTIPIGLSSLEVGDIIPWGKIMAGIVLSAFPITICFFWAWHKTRDANQISKYLA